VDDLVDIYSDVAPGLELFESGDLAAAKDHWQFWLSHHWGEHATSALRALWSFLAGRRARMPPAAEHGTNIPLLSVTGGSRPNRHFVT
jgi:hypothetical protein